MRQCKKYGSALLALGIGILAARLLPSGFLLVAAGIILVILGIVIAGK